MRDRVVLTSLRLLALAVVLYCLFRPTLVVRESVDQQNVVAVVLDDSRSMQIHDQDNQPRGQFVRNQFKFGADAAVAAGPVGRDAQANTDLQLRAEILSYSRSRGLFAGVTVNGSTVRADLDANQRFYGKRLDGPQLVLNNVSVEAPTPVPEWIQTLSRHIKR